jgi:hypothetical protein
MNLDRERLQTAVDGVVPLNAAFIGALIGRAPGFDSDAMFDWRGSEVDGDLVRRTDRVGQNLTVDGDRDFGVIDPGVDGQFDDAFVLSGRRAVVAREKQLRRRGRRGAAREQKNDCERCQLSAPSALAGIPLVAGPILHKFADIRIDFS